MLHKDKIVLITGASSGIGRACAEYFAQQGAKLILCARREAVLIDLKQELETRYQAQCLLINLDVRQATKVKEKLTSIPAEYQAIDILINNAGLAAGLDKFQEANLDDYEQMIDTNVKGMIYVTRFFLAEMINRNRGHVVNISSVSAHEVYPKGSVYCATKHAVDALTRGLRLDLLGTAIRVSAISPGLVETEFSKVRFKGDESKANKVYEGLQPLSPKDVAEAVAYCVSAPLHVNINEIILMPLAQAGAAYTFRKTS